MAKDRDGGTTLSVLRAEDVPLQEVSGVCLRREAGGDIAVVAFGDRTSLAAWVELPRDDADEFVWKPEDLALTRHGRAMIALDTKKAKENLVLLDPPIAAVGPA